MAYIGPEPAESFTSFATQTFSVSATTSYTLDHAVANENELALFINNVRQQPGSGKAYTATGTALTLSEATASGDAMYCVFLGRALQTVTPATNSVTSSMINYPLTTFSSTGIDDNASANSITIDSNGHVTMPLQSAVHAYPNTAQDNMSTGIVTIALGAEIYDVNSDFDTSSSTFTAPVTGKYQVNASVTISDIDTAYQWMYGILLVSSNRNYYLQQIQPRYEITEDYSSYGRGFNASTLVDMDANDTLLLKVRHSSHGSAQHDVVVGSASAPETFLTVHLAC
tara:strand:- start:326 stop:1177 length:852 start_codon:yes stop_codon:yes gene_type:complete